ncbi:hypothetical protein PR003_g23563 [Phytophthora rubi]|uniref:Tc1-like transposase DDE domain-containing protein n=1 Tax=Phytophthora rubi TaxID=129364 RepID=A0A6A3J8R6_9STRA|nr:hypothetical protein PR001_g21955 [Phytophthora rubi]KAE9297182.1 hypothetical protein PR003_g23563 [Phytophthora rubi]
MRHHTLALTTVDALGVNVRLQFQPPNFPDTNASDTGLFHAIQTLQQKKVARSLPELICVIHEAYWELPP